MRLDQFIATSSDLSRKEAKHAIAAGDVQVNGALWKNSAAAVPANAEVLLQGEPVALPAERYLMLNKPAGYISATRDNDQPTALDLLPAELTRNLHIAGRLDADTTGLLLLTTDGQWSHRVTSPRVECTKTYQVALSEPISHTAIAALETGVMLRNDTKPTKPAQVKVLQSQLIELTISEGRYHQVKRMMAAVGNHVTTLHRSRIGGVTLDSALAAGEHRFLTSAEIASFT
ncbi:MULTISPECIES: pseudouridine synthase [unclassified Marinobacter]|uniref:pseudouridine synthase n=1 Tax=unclassified Marinobacter TaxID=83889 RepID=UPI000BF49FB8|nr:MULTISPECIES: pseudouridine synthase [unclassified Marinobacter]PFG10953.1 16S rRNA pseudouridine516 synthase [Marinobacter sp. LV10MA510-1]PFG52846.1 16S rRNA pseudouridine516 synthase [Marinobacter sp. LV10R520-4]